MTSAAALAILLASQGSAALADDSPSPSEPPASDSASDSARALAQLEHAQSQASSGDIDGALESLRVAIEWDPSLASLYLMRAQLLLERLGGPSQIPADPAERQVWIERAEQAVSDLDRYIELLQPDPDTRRLFETKRDELRAGLDDARRIEEHDDDNDDNDGGGTLPIEPETPAREPTRRPALGLLAAGSLLSTGGVVVLSAGLQIRPQCRDAACSVAAWKPSTAWLPTGAALSVLGASMVTTGAVLLARRGPRTQAARRLRRLLAIPMLALAGATLVTSATLGGLSARRAGRDVDDLDGLSRTQSMSNAALAVGSLVPTLLGGGIGFLLPPRPRPR